MSEVSPAIVSVAYIVGFIATFVFAMVRLQERSVPDALGGALCFCAALIWPVFIANLLVGAVYLRALGWQVEL